MKKLFIILLLPLTLCGKPLIDDIFTAGKSDIEKKIKTAVKDEIGWDKKTIEKRLADGTYTETQIADKKAKIAKRIIREDVQERHDKIKPVPIEVVMIELNKIITQDIFVLTPATLRVFRADWKVIKRSLASLSPQEIEVLRKRFFGIGVRESVERPQVIETLLGSVDSRYIETAALFVLHLAPRKVEAVSIITRLTADEIKTLVRKYGAIDVLRPVLTAIEHRDIETVRTLLAKLQSLDLEIVRTFVMDLTAEAETSIFDDNLLKSMLRKNDYAGIETLLSKYNMPTEIKDAVIRGIMPHIEPFFVDAVFENNAYLFDKNTDREVKDGDIVIVNVSDLTDRVEFAKFIARNKGRRYIVQMGLGAMNNKDNPVTEWAEIALQFKEFYILAKSYDPGVCVGITVCAAPNWADWEKIFNFRYDVIFLWNIYKQGFSVRAVKKQYGDNIVIAGMNAMGESRETNSPGALINKVRDAGFKGVIWYNRHP